MAKVVLLGSRSRAALWLLIVAVPAAVLVIETARIAGAQVLADSTRVKDVERAIALDPDNPEFYCRLGRLRLSAAGGNAANAIASLREAIQLSPQNANDWQALAEGCSVIGDARCAAQGFERAAQLAPLRPNLQWEAANYYAATRQPGKTFVHLQRLLALHPSSADPVFRLTWRAFDDPAMVWRRLIAPSRNLAVQAAYLDFLGERKRFDLTGAYWAEVSAAASDRTTTGKPQRLTFPEVEPFLQRLMQDQQYEQAEAVWQDLIRLRVIPSDPGAGANEADAAGDREDAQGGAAQAKFAACNWQPGASGNLLYNGEFARPLLNAGFGWQTHPEEYLALHGTGEDADPGSGDRRGLRIDFTVPHNREHEPIDQLVPVVPGRKYVLEACLRSESITSDSGPRLRAVDPRSPQNLDVATEGVTGTTPWHAVSVEFTADATPVVRIAVWRPRSRTFPMDISGRAWVGAVRLRAAP